MVSNRSNGIYRSVIATLIGLAIVAVALFFLIRDLSTVDSTYSHAAADAAVEYERDAQAYIKETCFTPTGLREEDCAAKAREAAREGQRKEQDLAAQNITAWWTKVMGIAAMIGMALSAVGVWLVKATFDATREANDIARLEFEQGHRPWISVKVSGPYVIPLQIAHQGKIINASDVSGAPNLNYFRPKIEVSCRSDTPSLIEWFHVWIETFGPPGIIPPIAENVWIELTKDTSVHLVKHMATKQKTGTEAAPYDFGTIDLAGRALKNYWQHPPVVRGQIVYADPVGLRRIMGFAFQPSTLLADTFHRYGGSEWNYDRKIGDDEFSKLSKER